MHVHAETKWATREVWVWFFEGTQPGNTHVYRATSDDDLTRWTLEPWDAETGTEPSLVLPDTAAAALAGALSGLLPPDKAMARHLDDAITTRDRLLVLIEQTHQP